MAQTRRKTSRIYHVGTDKMVQIIREYELKFCAPLWYVMEYGPERPKTLGRFPTFSEARQFVRDYK